MKTASVHPKPFLKWVGGKRQLLEELTKRLPEKISRYHEPFLGGGALFFELIAQGRIEKAFLTDTNAELINAYRVVRNQLKALIRSLQRHRLRHSEKHYYQVRKRDPKKMPEVERASRLIYLNKTCYNGLYRVNSKGEFNVPFGRYKNPTICDTQNLLVCSKALRRANLACRSFKSVKQQAKEMDFVYFDPPYHPISQTSNFASYSSRGFGESDQKKLGKLFSELAKKGCKVMLSNSYSMFTQDLFSDWKIQTVNASRSVNSRASGRGPVKEIIVRNY